MPLINKEISDWVSINAESGLSAGSLIKVQNQGSKFIITQESDTKPDISSFEGEFLSTMFNADSSRIITEDSSEVWVRRIEEGKGFIKVYAQLWEA